VRSQTVPAAATSRVNPKAYEGDARRLCQTAIASLWWYRDENGRLQPTFARWQDYQPRAKAEHRRATGFRT
jgi:hypothetical protein